MFFTNRKNKACAQNEARLEDYLGRLREGVALAADTELIAHLDGCAGCRGALEDARQSSALLLQGRPPLPASLTEDPYFASRVSAHIRALDGMRGDAARVRNADFWPTLEVLSLRFAGVALSAAMILGAWAAWQDQPARTAETRRRSAITAAGAAGEQRRVEARVLFPEMKRPPDNAGEAMLVFASSETGRQR